jgi:hypothetical protein
MFSSVTCSPAAALDDRKETRSLKGMSHRFHNVRFDFQIIAMPYYIVPFQRHRGTQIPKTQGCAAFFEEFVGKVCCCDVLRM